MSPLVLYDRGKYNHRSHKSLVSIFIEDIATLLQRTQFIQLKIHQYRIRIYTCLNQTYS